MAANETRSPEVIVDQDLDGFACCSAGVATVAVILERVIGRLNDPDFAALWVRGPVVLLTAYLLYLWTTGIRKIVFLKHTCKHVFGGRKASTRERNGVTPIKISGYFVGDKPSFHKD